MERCWLEVADHPDLGADPHAPRLDGEGGKLAACTRVGAHFADQSVGVQHHRLAGRLPLTEV